MSDRVLDVARKLEVAVDLGSGRGWVTRHLHPESVGRLTAIELSPGLLGQAPDPEGLTMDRHCASKYWKSLILDNFSTPL